MRRLTTEGDLPTPVQPHHIHRFSLEGEKRLNWPQLYCLGSVFPEKRNPRGQESEMELRLFYPLKERNSIICMFCIRIIEWVSTVRQLPSVIDRIPIV